MARIFNILKVVNGVDAASVELRMHDVDLSQEQPLQMYYAFFDAGGNLIPNSKGEYQSVNTLDATTRTALTNAVLSAVPAATDLVLAFWQLYSNTYHFSYTDALGKRKNIEISGGFIPTGTSDTLKQEIFVLQNLAIPTLLGVSVADHLYGARASVTQSTDLLSQFKDAAELYGFKNNLQLTAFVSRYQTPPTGLAPVDATGKIKWHLYAPTDKWKHPVTNTYVDITDYYATVWSSSGATLFPGAVAGAAKAARYPNHGQEMYDISGGVYGWDETTGAVGTSGAVEYYGIIDQEESYFQTNIGRKPSTFSYRNGQKGSWALAMKRFLAGRNSDLNFSNLSGQAYTNYGRSKSGAYLGYPQADNTRQTRISSLCSTRTFDESQNYGMGTSTQALAFLQAQVALCVDNGGHFLDFMHWHNSNSATYINLLFQTMVAGFGSAFVHRCSYGELAEYLFLRDMTSVTSITESGGVFTVHTSVADPYKGTWKGIQTDLPLSRITVPHCFRIDTYGTILEGKEIQTSVGTIRKESANVFYVQVPFSGSEGTFTFTVAETATPSYLNFTAPAINSYVKDASTLTVNTSIPTKAVLFKVAAGGAESACVVATRSNTTGTQHVFSISALSGQDLRVGLISATNQSFLSGVL